MEKKTTSPLFVAINTINDKTKVDFDTNKISSYMLSLWLAGDNECVKYVDEISPYLFILDNKVVFDYYYKKIPKKRRFIKWVKKDESKEDEKIKELMMKYNLSEKEAKLSI